MGIRRFCYLAALLTVLIIYIGFGSWLSWLVLVAAVGLPWLSLLLSIPAMRDFRISPTGVDILEVGEPADLWLMGSCSLPMPPFRGNIRVANCFTGEHFRYKAEKGLSTAHCGGLRMTVEKARVCDYLGLFAFPPAHKDEKILLIRPTPLPLREGLNLDQFTAHRWHPKPGGGFSEEHELRSYRPGDSMNGIHWKLSAKTGSLVVREPMEPEQGRLLLTMDLAGSPEELDRKLGRLRWIGKELLDQQFHFEVRVLSGQGIMHYRISRQKELNRVIDALLCQPLAKEGSIEDLTVPAFWQYHIGGEADEV